MPLLDTGARCSEVVQLNLADLNLDLDPHRLRILHAKGNKQRVNEQVRQTALADPLGKFELGIRKRVEDLMIERMGRERRHSLPGTRPLDVRPDLPLHT